MKPPDQLCLECGYRFDAACPVKGPDRDPKAGDVCICLNCGQAAVFTAELRMRPMLQSERCRLPDRVQDTLRRARLFCPRALGQDLTKDDPRS